VSGINEEGNRTGETKGQTHNVYNQIQAGGGKEVAAQWTTDS
jgi:hypothetical protein